MARCSRKTFEWIAVLFIFAICILDFISVIVAKNCPRLPTDLDNVLSGTYEFYYRQIFFQIGWALVSIFLISYSFLIKACLLTWLAVILFSLYEITSLIYCLLPFEYIILLNIMFYGSLIGVSSILTLFIFQVCGWKS